MIVRIWSRTRGSVGNTGSEMSRRAVAGVLIALITAYGSIIGAGFDLVLFDELMKTIPPRHGVTFSAFQTSVANLAAIVAPLAGAALADQIGLAPGLLVAAVIVLAGAILFATAPRRTRAASGPTAPETTQGG